MPDPSDYESQDDFMSDCVPVKKAEGKSQEEAVASCLGTWEGRKEMSDQEKMYGEVPIPATDWVPFGVTSFSDLDKVQEERELADQFQQRLYQFHGLVDNVMWDREIMDKSTALQRLTDEFKGIIGDLTKELGPLVLKATWTTSYINDLPDSSFLYVESGGEKDSDGKTIPRSLRHLPYKNKEGKVDLPHLRNALSRLGQSETGSSEKESWLSSSLRKELRSKAEKILKQQNKERGFSLETALEWFRNLLSKKETPAEIDRVGPLMVWKDRSGTDRWLTAFSNKFRDRDKPSEILSSAAHEEFVKSVDSGEWSYPELWRWHIRDAPRLGVADWIEWDPESGFVLASGTFDSPEIAETVKSLCEQEDIAVSHGMPTKEIRRDPSDSSVITRYRTREISILPRSAAANVLTVFLTKETEMAISEEKKVFLRKTGMTDDQIAAVEKGLLSVSDLADQEGIESKEAEVEVGTEVQVEDQPVSEIEEEVSPETTPEEKETPPDNPITRDEIADAISSYVDPLRELVVEQSKAITALVDQLKSLQRPVIEKEQEQAGLAPAASIFDLLSQRAVGSEEAQIDGRSSLAKSGPQEVKPKPREITGIPFVDQMVRGNLWDPRSKSD